ncbi:hypothetical protein [Neorhizobium galegae]|uniref:hypothetical protein n=1 Tax=Neorhizobium galegae TaxID=399 RepID=UPI001F310851|nr:hypothetical protein [Neorhizobium galegae]UIK05030.1 hypothetical protein LZK81_20635 [Neorhizobium galegae]
MADRITRFRDNLGTADSYLHVMERMTESAFNRSGNDYCAFMLIIEAARKEISEAQVLVDEMEAGR